MVGTIKKEDAKMNTREIINKLPENVRNKVERMKAQYKICDNFHKRSEIRERIAGYVDGLRDSGFITERERQVVYVYATL